MEPDTTVTTETLAPRYPHLARALHEMPWAILPAKLDEIIGFLNVRLAGGEIPREDIEAVAAAARTPYSVANAVAVLPLYGTIIPRAGGLAEMSGATSVQRFRSAFNQALSDESVGSILIEVDSPGGSVDGIPELADEIRSARGTKPIVAIANTFAASAAYWIASQADELVVTPSGMVGSIGVLMTHVNEGPFWESQGVHVSYIYAGRYKVEGNPYEELGEEARDYYQGIIDDYYQMFVSAVAKGRGVGVATVRDEFGEGRMVMPREAVRRRMADRVETMQQTLVRLSGNRRRGRSRAEERGAIPGRSANADRLRREVWLDTAKRKGAS